MGVGIPNLKFRKVLHFEGKEIPMVKSIKRCLKIPSSDKCFSCIEKLKQWNNKFSSLSNIVCGYKGNFAKKREAGMHETTLQDKIKKIKKLFW
jgi:hypothetical protein